MGVKAILGVGLLAAWRLLGRLHEGHGLMTWPYE